MLKGFLKRVNSEKLIKPKDKIVVGFSGGPDSVFLVEMLKTLIKDYEIEIYLAHVNHLLRGKNSEKDELFSKNYAEKNGFSIFTKRVPVKQLAQTEKKGLEVVGREVRYQFFSEVMEKVGANKLAIAHNLDDQIENFLFRLIRGTTLKGLDGIKSHSNIIRPINWIYKKDILKYLDENDIKYRIDESNFENCYTRNSIRLELIPFIEEKYNIRFKDKIVNLIEEIKEVNQYLKIDLIKYIDSNKPSELDLKKLCSENSYTQRNIIYEFLYRFDIELSNDKIDSIVKLLSCSGTKVLDLGNNFLLIKQYNTLKVEKKTDDIQKVQTFNVKIPFSIEFGNYLIEAEFSRKGTENKDEFFTNLKIGDLLEIRTRKEGDRIKPIGMNSYKKVKELFINEKIPRLEREKIPLIIKNNELIWIPGVKKSDLFKSDKKSGIKLVVRRKNG